MENRREKAGPFQAKDFIITRRAKSLAKQEDESDSKREYVCPEENVRLPRREDAFGLMRGCVWAKERLSLGK